MHGQIYCLMNSGKPITKMLSDALLLNACDMFSEGRRVQRIKSPRYDGVIESNLEVIEYVGVPSVSFEAIVDTDKWEAVTIKFIVRVDDIDRIEMNQGQWAELMMGSIIPEGQEDNQPKFSEN